MIQLVKLNQVFSHSSSSANFGGQTRRPPRAPRSGSIGPATPRWAVQRCQCSIELMAFASREPFRARRLTTTAETHFSNEDWSLTLLKTYFSGLYPKSKRAASSTEFVPPKTKGSKPRMFTDEGVCVPRDLLGPTIHMRCPRSTNHYEGPEQWAEWCPLRLVSLGHLLLLVMSPQIPKKALKACQTKKRRSQVPRRSTLQYRLLLREVTKKKGHQS